MNNFKKQIEEDIREYQKMYPNMPNIMKDEWAFNFWILDKLYSEDEELIEEKIIDYNDKGIDCYVWHEDSKDLYLIQNKYYSDLTTLDNDYVQNDFLVRAIGALENGTYTRCHELQNIYSRYCNEEEFMVHFRLYVTNNCSKTPAIISGIHKFNEIHEKCDVAIYELDDIYELYFREPITNKRNLEFDIITINDGTTLNINTEAYRMAQPLDAKYVLVPIENIYDLCNYAKKEGYLLFDKNIREYLGASGTVNKGIKTTLKDKLDRLNFVYYNNGITMIVKEIKKMSGGQRRFKVYNPQIVNGCQTVSTITETLNEFPESSLRLEFKDCYVMLKILKIPDDTPEMSKLYQDIVTYNNSQNAINQKTFTANAEEFHRIKTEFERKGFLVCIKQSDKYSFLEKYPTVTGLLDKNKSLIDCFGLVDMKHTKNFMIDLEKLLQVILAFSGTSHEAIQKKSQLLKLNSEQYKKVVDFIKNPDITINDIMALYLLYLRAEQEKRKPQNEEGKMPVPLYVIHCLARYEYQGNVSINSLLDSEQKIENLIKKYSLAIKLYYKRWKSKNPEKDYNSMIKSQMDYLLMDGCQSDAIDLLTMSS